MADNFKILKQNLDSAIDPNAGIGEILAQEHNDVITEFINKAGKYTGLPFNSIDEKNGGIVPTGSLVWNNNAMNNTSDFVITISQKTLDLNNVTPVLNTLSNGAIIHFKDFVGRSVFLLYKSHVFLKDAIDSDIVDITVQGYVDNINYAYQDGESEVCVIEFFVNANGVNPYIIPFGSLHVYKKSTNNDNTILEAGDTVTGQLNNDIFLTRGVYVSGDALDVASYDDDSEFFDPNDV